MWTRSASDNAVIGESFQTVESQAQANHALAEVVEAYGRAVGQPVRMHRGDDDLFVVNLDPDHLGEVVAELGRPLRDVPLFDGNRPCDARAAADAFSAYCQDYDVAPYHIGFRLRASVCRGVNRPC